MPLLTQGAIDALKSGKLEDSAENSRLLEIEEMFEEVCASSSFRCWGRALEALAARSFGGGVGMDRVAISSFMFLWWLLDGR